MVFENSLRPSEGGVASGGEDHGIEGYLCSVWAGRPWDAGRRGELERVAADETQEICAWVARALGVDVRRLAPYELYRSPPAEGTYVVGRSWQAAATLALMSAILEAPPERPALVSGKLGPEGTWEAIEEVATKERVLAFEAPDVKDVARAIARASRPAAEALGPWFGGAECVDRARLRLSGGPSALATEAWDAADKGEWEDACAKARSVLRSGAEPTSLSAARAHMVLGEAALHEGRPEEGVAELTKARQAYEALEASRARQGAGRGPRPRRFELQEALARLAVGLLDALRPEEALASLDGAVERLDALAEVERDERWELIRVELGGTRSRLRLALGRLDRAREDRLRVLELCGLPQERARSELELAELERRGGRLAEARAALQRARRGLDDVPFTEVREKTERFLRLYETRAGVRGADYGVEPPRWRAWPQPGEVLEALIAQGPGALDAWLKEHVLGQAPGPEAIFLVVALSACARAASRHGTVPAMTAPVAAALAEGLGDAGGGPFAGWARETAAGPLAPGARSLARWVEVCPY